MEELVTVDRRDDSVVVITLQRPRARNAINFEMAQAIVDAFHATQDAAVIVLTGADPAFCAGLDLRNLGTENLADLPPFVASVATSENPVIAAVNGPAVTGGLELALACDFIVASELARFADTHLRVHVFPGPVLVDLPRRVGMARAREISLTGDFVDAAEAHRIGLVNRLVPHAQLLPTALELARSIAEQPRALVRATRRCWDATSGLAPEAARHEHLEHLRAYGATFTATDLAERRDDVVARAKRQP
jgi:enoyl-CoA hydratase/carnithine racemase